MSDHIFPLPDVFTIPVVGERATYPVRRIFCVGRNYVAHAAEMGSEVDREAPWYFTKSVENAVRSGSEVPYPPGTSNYHYEMELAFSIGTPVFRVGVEAAQKAVYAYCCALDMTRRDCQQDGKDRRRPWDLGKDFENASVFAPMTKAHEFGVVGVQRIFLEVDGVLRQEALLSDMVWSCAEVVAHLSEYYHLQPGDVIMTGTPAGVGPLVAGQTITGGINGLEPISLRIVSPA
ncbi:fumarylacetoacetate hydrolase family protein [Pseudopelagicola sp. nBUS_19]|uniref:fumarylacetoacetate hydrolase family protein n=1 Tax=Pseudopelagicola sp. nBUS_19 TaxID=3395316 RepID=UPI003EBFA4D0